MLNLGLNLLLILHFAFHLAAAFGGAWTFFHSYKEHKPSKWKLLMAVVWLAVSILLLVVNHESLHNHC